MPLRSSGPPSRRLPLLTPFRTATLAAVVTLGAPQAAQAQVTPGLVADPAGADAAVAADAFDRARALYDGSLFGPAAREFARFREAYPNDPRSAEALYLHAESALASADAEAAAVLFQQFEDQYPENVLAPRARLALGRFYYAQGDYTRAEEALTAALERPGPPEATAETAYLLGLTARRQNNPDGAIAAFERAAAEDTPSAPAALYALGTVHVERGNAEGVASAFERLGQRYPASPENALVRLALAEAYLRQGRTSDALAEAERRRPSLTGDDAERADLTIGEARLTLGDAQGAVAPLRAIPASSRYARRASLALGRALYAQGDVTGAAAELGNVRTETGGTPTGAPAVANDPLALEAAYYEGLALKEQGRLADAEARLASVAAYPTSAYGDAALLELGLLRYERRQTDEAVDAFRRLLAIEPQSPYAGEAARLLGETYSSAGRTAEASEAYRLAERLGTATDETRAEVAFQDAFARYRSGQYEAAIDPLLAVARNFPATDRAGEALFWAGESAFRVQRYDRAEQILTDFTTRFPSHRQADAGRYYLAWSFFGRRDYEGAITAFERFLSTYTPSAEATPFVSDALLRLGDSYYTLGRFDEARATYARVPQATPGGAGSDYALFQTAQTYASQGQPAVAIETYGQLVSSFPTSALLAEALLGRAELRAASGDADGAVADYERVAAGTAAGDAAPRALIGIGDVRFDQERYADAEVSYRLALDRYPSSPSAADALDGLSASLDALGRADEIEATADAAESRATNPEARARIRLRRAQTALEAGDADGAVRRLDALLRDNPPAGLDAEARLALGGAYLAQGRPAEAATAYRTLIARDPQGPFAPEAQLQLADALLAAGDARGALDAAAAFPRLFPGDPERAADALRREADALVALGRQPEADTRLRTIVERYPTSGAAGDVRRERPDLAPGAPTAPAPGRP